MPASPLEVAAKLELNDLFLAVAALVMMAAPAMCLGPTSGSTRAA